MKSQNLVRIVLWVTPEVKQQLTASASKEDRVLTNWCIRTLRTGAGLPPNTTIESTATVPAAASVIAPAVSVVASPVLVSSSAPPAPPAPPSPPAPSFSPVGPVTLPDGTVCDDPYGLNDEPAPRS